MFRIEGWAKHHDSLETEFIALKIKLGGYLTKESQPPGSVFAQRWSQSLSFYLH